MTALYVGRLYPDFTQDFPEKNLLHEYVACAINYCTKNHSI